MNIFQRLAGWLWRLTKGLSAWMMSVVDPPARKPSVQAMIMPPGHIPSSDLRGFPNYPWLGTGQPIGAWEMRGRYALVILPSLAFMVLLVLTGLCKLLGWALAKVAG